MATCELTLKDLEHLDSGRVVVAWQQALRRIVSDIEDRPAKLDKRTLTLKAQFKPMLDAEGMLESIKVDFAVSESIPSRSTRAYDMAARRGHTLVFDDLSDDNSQQMTIDDAIARKDTHAQ